MSMCLARFKLEKLIHHTLFPSKEYGDVPLALDKMFLEFILRQMLHEPLSMSKRYHFILASLIKQDRHFDLTKIKTPWLDK